MFAIDMMFTCIITFVLWWSIGDNPIRKSANRCEWLTNASQPAQTVARQFSGMPDKV